LLYSKALLEKPFQTFYYFLKNLFEKIESQNINLHLPKPMQTQCKETFTKGFKTNKVYISKGDVAPPMYDSAYYAIFGYVVADATKTKFLFLFLPRKEKIRDAIGVQYWWSVLSLKDSGWGPSSVLKMVAHQQKCPFYFSLFILVFGLGNSCPSC
jgi:hypothetical protein